MEKISESFNELENILDQAEGKCGIIITALKVFDDYVASYAAYRLGRKLQILGGWIIAWVERLYKEHNDKGYVCVFLSQKEGITPH